MSEPSRPPAIPPSAPPPLPDVEDARVAAALAGLADLDERPLAEHHERLQRAHEVLHEVLDDRPPG